MKRTKNDLLQGTLDLLVLQSVSLGPLHGLGVSDRIAQILRCQHGRDEERWDADDGTRQHNGRGAARRLGESGAPAAQPLGNPRGRLFRSPARPPVDRALAEHLAGGGNHDEQCQFPG